MKVAGVFSFITFFKLFLILKEEPIPGSLCLCANTDYHQRFKCRFQMHTYLLLYKLYATSKCRQTCNKLDLCRFQHSDIFAYLVFIIFDTTLLFEMYSLVYYHILAT